MREDQASQTAQNCAIVRAAHQLLDHPLLLNDPLSLRIIGAPAEKELRANLNSHEDKLRMLLRATIVARSRFSEDALVEALARGVSQYAILGAGFDTSAFRIAEKYPGVSLFEVDHPASQALKRKRIEEAQIEIPRGLSFVQLDFQKQLLSDVLLDAGLDVSKPVQFSWMGVLPYLPKDVIFSTLAYIASLPKGTEIVFGYPRDDEAVNTQPDRHREAEEVMVAGESLNLAQYLRSVPAMLADIDEPLLTRNLDPDFLRQELIGFGFSRIARFDKADLRELYFRGRSDGFDLRIPLNIMQARV